MICKAMNDPGRSQSFPQYHGKPLSPGHSNFSKIPTIELGVGEASQ